LFGPLPKSQSPQDKALLRKRINFFVGMQQYPEALSTLEETLVRYPDLLGGAALRDKLRRALALQGRR
jgi:hypothetical protein